MASTNSKNCKMNNGGYLNNRTYQAQRGINKANKEAEKMGKSFVLGLFGFLGLVVLTIFSEHSKKKQHEEEENLRIQKEIEKVKARQERNRKAAERKVKKQAKENELIDQWFKNMGKLVNGKYITISLDDYRKMPDKERKEWNKRRKV